MKFKTKLILGCLFILLISCKNNAQEKEHKSSISEESWIIDFMKRNFININEDKLDDKEFDFSTILYNKETKYLGYIGKNKQKLNIEFDHLKKSLPGQKYDVSAKVNHHGISKEVKGCIDSISIYKLKNFTYGVDDWMKGKVKNQGITIARYILKENNSNKGIYKGQLVFSWYVDNKGNLKYDNIESDRDGYSNNQFYGYYKGDTNDAKQYTAWGHYRIPKSGDLDIGVAEFSVNPKYLKFGWEEIDNTSVTTDLHNHYSYYKEAPVGKDIRLGVNYELKIKEDKVIFSMDSYFTQYKYLCSLKEEKGKINIYFQSVIEGEKKENITDPMIIIQKKKDGFYAKTNLINKDKEVLLQVNN